ncbi:MAG: sugar phosphate isomerase/epimerase [Verrucomicrobia bacterium]|nr:sugar phosphate isomerase/epimerase [Verrucomicrobiota bacterium]
MNRRTFLKNSVMLAGATCGIPCSSGAQPATAAKQPLPLKIGIRAASMKMAGNFDVIRTAAGMPGIMGVELQVTAGSPNLRDWDAVRRYKREADRWAMRIPSLAGVWDRGVEISSPAAAENIRLSIRAAELLGSSALLLAFFKKQAPDMTREDSYGPIVAMLKEVAPRAADAGVALGLENSLSPADNAKLVDLVGHPAVGVYYDLHNMAFYGHGDQAIPGVKLLGRERICAVHVKNDDKLIEEPGPIDWAAAFRTFNAIGYEGWYVYETSHANIEDCIADTQKNNAFMRQHARMSAA